MKKYLALLSNLAVATATFAAVDPQRPMVTGRGNVDARPGAIVVTNQTKPKAEAAVTLDKFEVTGSLIRPAAEKVAPPKKP